MKAMWKPIFDNVAVPLVNRIGSVMAGALVAVGATQPQVNTVETALVAILLVCVDLIMRKVFK